LGSKPSLPESRERVLEFCAGHGCCSLPLGEAGTQASPEPHECVAPVLRELSNTI
jgi:hypothetical protein